MGCVVVCVCVCVCGRMGSPADPSRVLSLSNGTCDRPNPVQEYKLNFYIWSNRYLRSYKIAKLKFLYIVIFPFTPLFNWV